MVTRNVVRSGITRNVTRGVTESFFSGLTPQLHYEFSANKTLTATVGPALSITRATSGTYRDNTGTIQTAGSGVARFDHNASGTSLGLLVEEARTQQAIWTEDISNAAWVASNITKGTTSVTAPDGASNSNVRLTASAGNGTLLQTLTSASATRVYSVYMKRVTGTGNIDLTLDGGSTWTTKTLTSEWQRFDITQAAVTNPSFGVRIVTSGDAIDFWGSELNSGATFPTSYISNNSATASVTRNADVVSTTDLSWQTAGIGSFYANFELSTVTTGTRYILGADSSSSKRIVYNQNNTIQSYDGGAPALSILSSGATVDTDYKVALSYADAVDNYDGYINGSASSSGPVAYADGGYDVATTFVVGDIGTGGQALNGHIAEIRYYNERLTNAQLEDMSNGVFP